MFVGRRVELREFGDVRREFRVEVRRVVGVDNVGVREVMEDFV